MWTPEDVAVLLAQGSGCGSAADCLCPAIAFYRSRRSAEDHLRALPELTGRVLDQTRAVEVARLSFGSLLAPATMTVETPSASTAATSIQPLIAAETTAWAVASTPDPSGCTARRRTSGC